MLPFREAPMTGTEMEILRGLLDENRAVVVWKLDGLSDELLGWSPVPSGTSMGGIVKHLAYVELSWFCDTFAGQDRDWPAIYPWSREDPDAEFRVEPGETVQSVRELYVDCVRQADEVLDAAPDLDARCSSMTDGREPAALRWVITHMIEETARHLGHLDIIREQADGTTGYMPHLAE